MIAAQSFRLVVAKMVHPQSFLLRFLHPHRPTTTLTDASSSTGGRPL
jgi:hypothetical protein